MHRLFDASREEHDFSIYMWDLTYKILQKTDIQKGLTEIKKAKFHQGYLEKIDELLTTYCRFSYSDAIPDEDSQNLLRSLWRNEVENYLETFSQLRAERELILQEYKRSETLISNSTFWMLGPGAMIQLKKLECQSFKDITKEDRLLILDQKDYINKKTWLPKYYYDKGQNLAMTRKYLLANLNFDSQDSYQNYERMLGYTLKLLTQESLLEYYKILLEPKIRREYDLQTVLFEQFLANMKQKELMIWKVQEMISFQTYYYDKFPCCCESEYFRTGARKDKIGFSNPQGISYPTIIEQISSDESEIIGKIFYCTLKSHNLSKILLNNSRCLFYSRLTELLFYIEPKRWISALIHNVLFLDMVRLGKYNAQDIINLPMSTRHAVAITRKIKDSFKFNEEYPSYFYDMGRSKKNYLPDEMLFLLKEMRIVLDWCIAREFFYQEDVINELVKLDGKIQKLKNGQVLESPSVYTEIRHKLVTIGNIIMNLINNDNKIAHSIQRLFEDWYYNKKH